MKQLKYAFSRFDVALPVDTDIDESPLFVIKLGVTKVLEHAPKIDLPFFFEEKGNKVEGTLPY